MAKGDIQRKLNARNLNRMPMNVFPRTLPNHLDGSSLGELRNRASNVHHVNFGVKS